MSDQNAKTALQKASDLTKPPAGSKLSTWQVIVRVIAIGIPILGAIPTAYTLYQSYQHGIPYKEVAHRLQQFDLWEKNFDCQINYQALNTGQGTRVDVGACPKTGDIAIKVSTKDGVNANYEWIPYEDISGNKSGISIFGSLVSPAMASDLVNSARGSKNSSRVEIAQSTGMTVLCQKLGAKRGQVTRVVQEDGKCFREEFSMFKGTVENREEVSCETTCNGESKG